MFWLIFAGITLKLGTVGPIFSSFNSCPLFALRSNKQLETVSVSEYSLK